MDVQWLLIIHGLLTLLVVVSFLCGQWPIFEGTPIQRIHYFLTFGAYDYFLYSLSHQSSFLSFSRIDSLWWFYLWVSCSRFVGFVFGEKAINAILSVEYFCCDRPNPVLQVSNLFELCVQVVWRCEFLINLTTKREFESRTFGIIQNWQLL